MSKHSINLAALKTVRMLRFRTGRRHIVLTGRGATGIWAVLRALGINNQSIGIPANTCYIVLWAVLKSGNYPLLLDVDGLTGNITAETLAALGDTKPAAIIPAHMYGFPAPLEAITAWAKARGIVVIEDAALALGGSVESRAAGGWGQASILSFGQGKIADHQVGGALATDDPALAQEVERLVKTLPMWDERLRRLTNQWHGLYWPLHQYESRERRLLELYPHLFEIYGEITTYRLHPSHWQGFPKTLAVLRNDLAHRRHLAALYDDGLKNVYRIHSKGMHWWRYPLRVIPEIRQSVLDYLWENGVYEATRWYPSLRPMCAALAPQTPQPPTPNADAFAATIINLPLDLKTADADVARITQLVRRHFGENE